MYTKPGAQQLAIAKGFHFGVLRTRDDEVHSYVLRRGNVAITASPGCPLEVHRKVEYDNSYRCPYFDHAFCDASSELWDLGMTPHEATEISMCLLMMAAWDLYLR